MGFKYSVSIVFLWWFNMISHETIVKYIIAMVIYHSFTQFHFVECLYGDIYMVAELVYHGFYLVQLSSRPKQAQSRGRGQEGRWDDGGEEAAPFFLSESRKPPSQSLSFMFIIYMVIISFPIEID